MKKISVASFFFWGMFAVFFSVSYAQVPETPHHLTTDDVGASGLCLACHLTENTGGQTPLWNTEGTDAPSTFYDSTTNLALDISQKCLSCHDGSVSVDRLGNRLYKDHPVSVPYTAKAGKFRHVDGTVGVKLFSGKIECVSCHHPHDSPYEHRLRSRNTGSSLCLSCHIK